MTISYPTDFETVTADEIIHGRPVSVGSKDELASIGQAQTRQMSGNLRTQAVVLSCSRDSIAGRVGVPGLSSTTVDVANGRMRLWDVSQQLQLVIYGSYVRVYLYIGGAYQGFVDAGALGWASSSVFTPTLATIDADGFADVRIRARTLTGTTTLLHAGVIEIETASASLPDGNSTIGELAAFDDSVFTADQPLDSWALQQVDDNATWTKRQRSRGVCHLYPRTNPHYLSSVFWRADGPYMIAAQPWADTAEVTISIDADSNGGWVFIMSEMENFQDVAIDRAVEIISAFEHHTFEVKIQPGIDREQKIWVLFQSNRNNTLINTYDAYNIQQRISRLYSELLPPATLQPMAWGDIFESGMDDNYLTVTGKGVLSYEMPKQSWDVGAYAGDVSNALSDRSISLMTPHVLTGLIDATQLDEIYDSSTAVTFAPSFEHRKVGVLELTSVLVEVLLTDPTRKKLAQPGYLPSSSIIERAIGDTNTAAVWGSPQLIVRHWGWRNMYGDTGTTGTIVNNNEGHWLFLPAQDTIPQTLPIYLPIFKDPNLGAGLASEVLYGRVTFYATTNVVRSIESTAAVECFFSVGGVDYNSPNGGTEDEVMLGGVATAGIANVTLGDALLASTCTVVDTTPPMIPEQTEHAYTQQFTWPNEINKNSQFWQASAVFEAPIPTSYPAEIQVKIKFTPASGSSVLVVSGLHVWVGPRLTP